MRRNELNPVWTKSSAFTSAQTFDYKYFKRYYGRTIMQPRPVLPSPVLSPPSGKASSARVESSEGALFEIQSQARYVFTPDEFATRTGRVPDSNALKMALQRLARQGRITLAIKRPAHWLIVPPEQAAYSAPPVVWWLHDCLETLEPNYYVALLSAARHWGSAHYALQATQVMVGKPRLPIKVGKLQVDFHTKKNIAKTPTTLARNKVARIRVSTREATLLDLIRFQASIGGIEAVCRIAKDFSKDMTAAGMVEALGALDQVYAAQRLGFILDQLGLAKLSNTVFTWLKGRRLSNQPLAPLSADEHVPEFTSSRWHIRYTPMQEAIFQEMKC